MRFRDELRDTLPPLWRQDPADVLAVWRDFGWLLGMLLVLIGIWASLDIAPAIRKRQVATSVGYLAVLAGILMTAAGLASIDAGWLLLGVAFMLTSAWVVGKSQHR